MGKMHFNAYCISQQRSSYLVMPRIYGNDNSVRHDMIQGLANNNLHTNSISQSIFVNKTLLGYKNVNLFAYVTQNKLK